MRRAIHLSLSERFEICGGYCAQADVGTAQKSLFPFTCLLKPFNRRNEFGGQPHPQWNIE